MTKIRKIIKINSGYTHYVDLNADFFYYDEEKNLGRMERYEPIRAHRLAFEKIANSLNPKDRRFYFLSGSYGTGKSHLCLMLGNYLAKQSNSLEMETFFNNYEKAQKEVKLPAGKALDEKPASSLKAARKQGKYLVGICRYGLNLEFEGVVLRALEEALEKSPDNLSLDTHYKAAVRKLKNWEKRKAEKPFFKAFKKELMSKHSEWPFSKLLTRLQKADEKAFNVFKQVHKEVTDSDFTFSKDNLRDILVDLLTNEEFKKAYQGIAIIYDELGYALDGNLVNLKLFHEFAQFCANSGLKHLPIIFIGTGHKLFVKHGQVGEAVHYNTIKDRVNEINLQTDGMEDLIGAIVQQQRDNPIWEKEVTPHTGTFARFPVECKRLGIFNWLEAPKLKRSIIENIYPMHPLATYALLQMAQELGSDNRSVVKFFSPEFESGEEKWKNVQKYSYPWFIEHTDIIEDNKLKLYTSDLLFDYFKNSIEKGETKRLPRIKASISNYEATLRSLIGYTKTESQTKLFAEIDPEMGQLLKSMLVNEIISNEDIPIINTAENILFALNAVTEPDKKRLIARLEILCTVGVIFKNDNKIYEFRRSDVKDVRQMINQFRANPENYPENLLEKFLDFMPLKPDEMYLEAKDYNTIYNEDKRLQVRFVTPPELDSDYIVEGEKVSFFEKLERERVEAGYGRTGYEGSAVFVFCDKEESIEQGKKSLRLNSQERVVVAVPKKHMEVLDDVLTLMAIQAIQASKEAETFGPHENAQLIEIKKTAQRKLEAVKNRYFDNKHMAWFWTKGEILPVNETKKHDMANKVMNSIFDKKRNKISHMDFNKVHIKNDGVMRRILLEAGNLLLDLTGNIAIDWTLPDNRGGRKYLRRCFVDNQLLHHIHPDGDIRYFEVERDNNKFKDSFPAYAHMIEELSELKGKGAMLCKQFFRPYFEEYGQGEIAITLLLLLAYRFYGDSLRVSFQ